MPHLPRHCCLASGCSLHTASPSWDHSAGRVPCTGPLCQGLSSPCISPSSSPSPAPACSPAWPAASQTPSIVKDMPCDRCPNCWSPPALRETFCYLQDEAKSPFRLKIPSDWTPFGGRPRQTEHNPGQPLTAQAAQSCQPVCHDPSATRHRGCRSR